jgi:hypothetical protein
LLDCGFLGGSVHSLDLSVGPGVLWFGQPMIDIVFGTGEFESVSTEPLLHGHFAGSRGTFASSRYFSGPRRIAAIVVAFMIPKF